MKPEKPTSLAPDGKDLDPRIVEIVQRLKELSSRSNAQKADGRVSVPPRSASAYGTLIYDPLPLDGFSESREDGVAEKARSIGRFVGHAAASAALSELFRAARRSSVRRH